MEEKGGTLLAILLFMKTEGVFANLQATSRLSYVAQKDTREVIDITTLNVEIAGMVARQNELRTAIDEIAVDLEGSR